jgi:hypothetical protein
MLREMGYTIEEPEVATLTFGRTTRQAVLDFQSANRLPTTGVVDDTTFAQINAALNVLPARSFIVSGEVQMEDGRPVERLLVRVLDRDLRSSRELANEWTGADGRFQARFTKDDFARAEKGAADLTFQIENQEGLPITDFQLFRTRFRQSILVEEPQVIFNAGPDEFVTLVLANKVPQPSEYERYLAKLRPVLQGLAVDDLTDDDLIFLAGETGILRQHLSWLVIAARLGTSTPPELFYGLFRQQLPTTLEGLSTLSRRNLRRALERSFNEQIIPLSLQENLDTLLEALQRQLAAHALRPVGEGARVAMADLWLTSGLPQETLEPIWRAFVNREAPTPEFWQAMRGEHGESAVDDLQRSLSLGQLLQNNLPLIKALQPQLRQAGAGASLRPLARRDRHAWKSLLQNTPGALAALPQDLPGETPDQKLDTYTTQVVTSLNASFPTTFVALGVARQPVIAHERVKELLARLPTLDPAQPLPAGVEISEEEKEAVTALRREIKMFPAFDYRRALADAGDSAAPATIVNPIRQAVARAFANIENNSSLLDFDIQTTHIDSYLAQHAAFLMDGIAEEERDAVTEQLKATQRVSRIATNYDHIELFMGEGVRSAFQLATLPKQYVLLHFDGLPEVEKEAYYRKSAQLSGTTTIIAANVHDVLYDAAPISVGNGKKKEKLLKIMPNLRGLFGSLDLCECEHCRSVYSPAAYLVELLQFLNFYGTTLQQAGLATPLEA